MKRTSTFAAVAAAGLALAVSSEAAPTTASTPTESRGAGKWTKVSTGDVQSISEPALYRTGDGVLHVAYAKGGSSDALRWSNVSKHGRLLGQGTILSGWDIFAWQPKLIPAPNNQLRLVFGGIDADGPFPYNDNRLYAATAGAGGESWTLAPGSLTEASLGTYGIGAVAMPGQAPIVAAAYNNDIYWRQADGSATPTTPDNHFTNVRCCAYHTALARDASNGRVVLGWAANGDTSNTNGVFARQLLPTLGPKMKAPGSSRFDPDQTVALTPRRDAPGTYLAYCTGYPNCRSVKLWRVGAPKAITVPRSRNADEIAIAAAPSGRLWVVWDNETTNRVYATLTNKKATRFGTVRAVKTQQLDTYRVSAYAGAVRQLDVVINTNGGLLHRQLLPGLKLTAKPQRFDNDKRRVVTFTVTDAGAPVTGAKVRIAGKTDVTGVKGKAMIAFRKGFRPGRYHGTVSQPAYAKGTSPFACGSDRVRQ